MNSIEARPNLHLRYMGVDCWPIVRNTFMSMLSHSVTRQAQSRSVASLVRALRDFIYLCFSVDRAHAIVLTDFKYQVKVENVEYFKDATVIKELLKGSEKECHILTQSVVDDAEKADQSRTIYFLTALAVVLSRILMWLDFRSKVPNYLRKIYNSPELEGLKPDELRNFKQVKKNIYFVIVASSLFTLLLKRIRPKKCFIVCYYSCLGMALCVACRKLGIESIDIQHGVSGTNMRAYGQWSNIPKGGFNTLPQTFYCWTSMDVAAINLWSTKTRYHRSVLTGNLWRQYQQEKRFQKSAEELELVREIANHSKIVLYTAQKEDLPELVVNMLYAAPESCFFMIRMHPDMHPDRLETMSKKLKLINTSCSVINATKSRIQVVSRLADLHVTEWSAAVYDATYERLESVVISKVGEDYFEDFIYLGLVRYCETAPEILGSLSNIKLLGIENDTCLNLQKINTILLG